MDPDERSGMVCAWLALVAIVALAAALLVVLAWYAQDSFR